MSKLAIGVLAFAAGAAAGGLFVRWYVSTHPGSLAGEQLGAKIFGEGSTGQKAIVAVGGLVDQVFVQ